MNYHWTLNNFSKNLLAVSVEGNIYLVCEGSF